MSDPVVYTDLKEFANELAQLSDLTPDQITQNIMHDLGPRIVGEAQARAPKKTGALAKSIKYTTKDGVLEISASAKYANFQEFGTASRGEFGGAPYTIAPKKARALRFVSNGRVVYTRRVVHPGIPPRPYMRPAAIAVLGPFMVALLDRGQALIVKGPNSVI